MVLEFLSRKPKPHPNTSQTPVLSDEDEKFLDRLTSEEAAPALPARPIVLFDNGPKDSQEPAKPIGKDAQIALMDGADQIALPPTPPVGIDNTNLSAAERKSRNYWAFLPTVQMPNMPNMSLRSKSKDRSSMSKAGQDLASAAATLKAPDSSEPISDLEKQNEENELTTILDQLNLSAINNRAFSFSKESQKLMTDFTQVLKDIVNGVPTAYDDLEKLLTTSDKQLRKTFTDMPPFIQAFIKTMPAKLSGALAPGLLAASAEKPGLNVAGAATKSGSKLSIPNLKSLITAEGAVAGMLRSILNFLKLRFPAFVTGTNILMSLAVFLLLFVFWYCHKRGREVRLEGEKAAAEGSSAAVSDVSDIEDSIFQDKPGDEEERRRLEEVLNRPVEGKGKKPQ